jgi:pimeloyl-ACP methyl ester carboxylesterase
MFEVGGERSSLYFPPVDDLRIPVPDGHINVWHRPAGPGEPTAVLIHGLTGNSRWWARVIDHLPPGLGLLAVDVRGRGGSRDAPPPYDLTTIAHDVATCLDHVGEERAIVAGYSMGAWIAAIFGRHHPDRTPRLVLIDGGLPVPAPPGRTPQEIIDAVVGPSLTRLEMQFADVEAYLDYWKAHPALSAYWEEEMGPMLAHELIAVEGGVAPQANGEAIAIAGAEISADAEANEAAAGTSVPTLLVVVERGTMDQPGGMTPRADAEAAALANPNLTVEYLADLNHYTLMLGKGAARVAATLA